GPAAVGRSGDLCRRHAGDRRPDVEGRCGFPDLDRGADAGEAQTDGLGSAWVPVVRYDTRVAGEEADLGSHHACAPQGLTPADIKALIRTIPDFPAAGIQFRDITTLIGHGEGLAATIDHLVMRAGTTHAAAVAGIEARGFIFGAAVAARLGLGFVPLRKAGKLPVASIGVDYALEY